MSELTQTLREKDQVEQQQRTQIKQVLSSLESQVKELELEAKSFRDRLAEQNFRSLRDSLTEIPNRAAYDERLQLEFKRWQRFSSPLCIVLADVDADERPRLGKFRRRHPFVPGRLTLEFGFLLNQRQPTVQVLLQAVQPRGLGRERCKGDARCGRPNQWPHESANCLYVGVATHVLDVGDEAIRQARHDGQNAFGAVL